MELLRCGRCLLYFTAYYKCSELKTEAAEHRVQSMERIKRQFINCAKCEVLSFVLVLVGYEATPTAG